LSRFLPAFRKDGFNSDKETPIAFIQLKYINFLLTLFCLLVFYPDYGLFQKVWKSSTLLPPPSPKNQTGEFDRTRLKPLRRHLAAPDKTTVLIWFSAIEGEQAGWILPPASCRSVNAVTT